MLLLWRARRVQALSGSGMLPQPKVTIAVHRARQRIQKLSRDSEIVKLTLFPTMGRKGSMICALAPVGSAGFAGSRFRGPFSPARRAAMATAPVSSGFPPYFSTSNWSTEPPSSLWESDPSGSLKKRERTSAISPSSTRKLLGKDLVRRFCARRKLYSPIFR